MATLKRIEKIVQENVSDEKKKRPGLKFNPGLALIGLRTTGPRLIETMNPHVGCQYIKFHCGAYYSQLMYLKKG